MQNIMSRYYLCDILFVTGAFSVEFLRFFLYTRLIQTDEFSLMHIIRFINAETEEELEQLMKSGGEVMTQAVGAYHSITADKQFQYLETLRAKAKHDEAQALSNARRQGAKAEREKLQGVIDEKDTALAEKDARIAKLEALLKK